MNNFATVILAAGKSKRMKTSLPKVLHKAMGKTLVNHVLDACFSSESGLLICVASAENKDALTKAMPPETLFCVQQEQLGTADAVKTALSLLQQDMIKNVLVVPGDMPLLKKETIRELIRIHENEKNLLTVLTGIVKEPFSYGRIIRDSKGIIAIVEEKDLRPKQRQIHEVNSGVYVFDVELLTRCLSKINKSNAQKEFYLTDSVQIALKINPAKNKKGKNAVTRKVDTFITNYGEECLGVNSRKDLAVVIDILRKRKLQDLMDNGVTIEDPSTTFIDSCVQIGKDTIIKPFTIISGNVAVGEKCEIGPYAHVHENIRIADQVCIGNFVEVKRSVIGKGSKAKHLTYLGDTTLGEKVNIGAGTITANYDGHKKHPTVIGDGSHIGSNTVVVAPNVLGKNVTTGGGSVIPAGKSIPDNSLVYGVPARVIKQLT